MKAGTSLTTSTRSDHRTRFTGVLVLAVLLLLATSGCIPGTKKEEPTMTPDQATQEMVDTLTAAMTEIVPGFKFGSMNHNIECGGLVGTDDSKVRASVNADIAGPIEGDKVARITKALRGHGIKIGEFIQGKQSELLFRHNTFIGSVIFRANGTLTVGADTVCLKNPDRS